jgi:hypothetical protein
MTLAERAAMLELEAAELAANYALAAREAARERLELVIRRECRRERAEAPPHLRLIVGARR